MNTKKLKIILENHYKWLHDKRDGKRAILLNANLCNVYLGNADLRNAVLRYADLRNADLRGADLRYADLRYADLRYADLCYADLRNADLSNANLHSADLRYADLRYADLGCANLCSANLRDADLHCANLFEADLCSTCLCSANLCDADLSGANLRDADLHCADLLRTELSGAKNVPFIPMVPPESGSFIGWKKTSNDKIVKLLVPKDAKRSSATTRKCRCDKAKVLAIENLNGSKTKIKKIASAYDKNFVYEVGKTIEVPDFCENRWEECAAGIYFFVNRQEAVEY